MRCLNCPTIRPSTWARGRGRGGPLRFVHFFEKFPLAQDFQFNIANAPNPIINLKETRNQHCKFSNQYKKVMLDGVLSNESFKSVQNLIGRAIKINHRRLINNSIYIRYRERSIRQHTTLLAKKGRRSPLPFRAAQKKNSSNFGPCRL